MPEQLTMCVQLHVYIKASNQLLLLEVGTNQETDTTPHNSLPK